MQRLEFFTDYICPWCYLCTLRLERLRAELDVDVVVRHFPLHPETPPAGQTLEQLFAGRNIDIPAAQSRIRDLIQAEGLPYGPRTMTYNSRLAQELAAWASTQPGGWAIHMALYQAYFVHNTNLAQVDALVELAGQAGLAAAEARAVLDERRCRDEVDADWQLSHDLGITGVPAFKCGNQILVGAQPYEQLTALVQSA